MEKCTGPSRNRAVIDPGRARCGLHRSCPRWRATAQTDVCQDGHWQAGRGDCSRSVRLVVDSSISMVTANTVLPNHMLLPRISDVMQCAPMGMSAQQMTQLTLDVSKSHRRILVAPEDGGLLCFHANRELYRCITLNFGACASGWYRGRLASIMVRSCHSLLAHGHALWQYVDDLLAWLDKSSSPLWASLIVVLLFILGVPMSALADTVDWIGWRISVSSWTVAVPQRSWPKLLTRLGQFRLPPA